MPLKNKAYYIGHSRQGAFVVMIKPTVSGIRNGGRGGTSPHNKNGGLGYIIYIDLSPYDAGLCPPHPPPPIISSYATDCCTVN